MRLRDDLRRCVGFIGFGSGEDFQSVGSGFFIAYGGVQYLVTARHIAEPIGDDPFGVRVNRREKGTLTWQCDPHAGSPIWHFSEDENVDAAVMLFVPPRGRQDSDLMTLAEGLIADQTRWAEENIGVGDVCYAVGLFRLLAGRDRILPFVHTGNIGLLPGDEKIPSQSWRPTGPRTLHIEGYLVEMTSIRGLSGSPVFARPTFGLRGCELNDGREASALLANEQIYLIGLWQSAWDGDPDDTLRHEAGDFKVPVGIGVVTPIEQVVAILNSPAVVAERNAVLQKWNEDEAAKPD